MCTATPPHCLLCSHNHLIGDMGTQIEIEELLLELRQLQQPVVGYQGAPTQIQLHESAS